MGNHYRLVLLQFSAENGTINTGLSDIGKREGEITRPLFCFYGEANGLMATLPTAEQSTRKILENLRIGGRMRLNLLAFVSMAVIFFNAISAQAGVGVGFDFSKGTTTTYSGRYAYISGGDFLLDTETGRMWQMITISVHGGTDIHKLMPVPYEDLNGKKAGVCPEPQDTTLPKGH